MAAATESDLGALVELRLLLEVSQAVATTLDLEHVLQVVADGTARLLDVETAAVYLIEGENLYLGATTPPLAPGVPETVRWARLADHPHIARAITTQTPLREADAASAQLSPAERAVVELRGLRSLLYLPFSHEGEPIGVLILGTVCRPRDFTDRELDLCRTLTNELALGVQNARLHAGLQAHAAELETQIAERARVERELRKSEARFRALFEQAGDYLLLLEPEGKTLRIVDANQAACEIHGYRHEELCGAPLSLLDHAITEARLQVFVEEAMRGNAVHVETEHLRRDGSVFPVEATGKLVVLEDGTSFIISVERDVTERKALAEQLRHAQKMEAVGQLAGGIAHDFNNLLQVVHGFAGLAQEQTTPGSDIHESLGFVLKAADQAASLVRQLLAFSRREVLSLQRVDLGHVVRDLLPMLRPLLGEHIEVTLHGMAGLAAVTADPNQIEQILVNLCVNARDAMPGGGSLTLTLEHVAADESLCQRCSLESPGPYVLLSVTDTGCGMDAATLERAFDPFFTTKELGAGTGLGLASVYGLVKQHSGAIQVRSEVGRGTRFDLYLPAAEHALVQRRSTTPAPSAGGRETILIAEDHELVLKLARLQLERAGYRVLAARDGEEALRLLGAHGRDVDLALLDVIMPKLGGEAVFQHLRRQHPDLPVVFSSAYGARALPPSVLGGTRVTILQKPFSERALLSSVRQALGSDWSS